MVNVLIVIALVIGSFNLVKCYTSCTQLYDCSSCISAYISNGGFICYWCSSTSKCSSFKDSGCSKTCSNPTSIPTKYPTYSPSYTSFPSIQVTYNPTIQPTNVPSSDPSSISTSFPIIYPSSFPTTEMSNSPSASPSIAPSELTDEPTITNYPTTSPASYRSQTPSLLPSYFPTENPLGSASNNTVLILATSLSFCIVLILILSTFLWFKYNPKQTNKNRNYDTKTNFIHQENDQNNIINDNPMNSDFENVLSIENNNQVSEEEINIDLNFIFNNFNNHDIYDILKIPNGQNASQSDIKAAYRKLAKVYHPDKLIGKPSNEIRYYTEKMKELSYAFLFISNNDKRFLYDQGMTALQAEEIVSKYQ